MERKFEKMKSKERKIEKKKMRGGNLMKIEGEMTGAKGQEKPTRRKIKKSEEGKLEKKMRR